MAEAFLAFIRKEDEVLLLRRSKEVAESPALWDGVYGLVDVIDETSVTSRVEEATGIPASELTIVRNGQSRGLEIGGRLVDVTPILLHTTHEEIQAATLYTEHEWIDPGTIQHTNTTPLLSELYGDVAAYVYIVKTTINQEQKVAQEMQARLSGTGSLRDSKDEIFGILHPPQMRGYLFIEASARHHVENLIGRGGGATTPLKNAKAVLGGEAPLKDVTPYLEPKAATVGIEIGTIVEIATGAFRGEKARVTNVSENKDEITMVLYEAAIPMELTMRADHVRIIDRIDED